MGTTNDFAAALLLRQALETALGDFWTGPLADMAELSWRVQLIALRFYAGEHGDDLAETLAYTWYRLSSFCHHDAYELPPPKHEIEICAAAIEAFLHLSSGNPAEDALDAAVPLSPHRAMDPSCEV
jgi:hypothetical protein